MRADRRRLPGGSPAKRRDGSRAKITDGEDDCRFTGSLDEDGSLDLLAPSTKNYPAPPVLAMEGPGPEVMDS